MLVLPAAAAQQLTTRPAAGIAISVVLGLAIVWLSLSVAFFLSDYPIGFFVTTFGLVLYLGCRGVRRLRP
jgi:zinc/manganese transport system permease protein